MNKADCEYDIVVTGGRGYLGIPLVQSLCGAGQRVLVIGRSRGDQYSVGNCCYATWDSVAVNCGHFHTKTLVHLASELPQQTQKPVLDTYSFYHGGVLDPAIQALRLFRERCAHFILASSVSVYGSCEGAVGPATMPLPDTLYGAFKFATETLCQTLCKQLQITFTSLRFAQLWGMNEPHGRFVHRAFLPAALHGSPITVTRGGRQLVNLLWLDDAVEALQLALKTPHGGVYDIVNRHEISVIDLAKLFQKHAKGTVDMNVSDDGEPILLQSYNDQPALDAFGFCASVGYEEAVKRLLR